MSTVNKSEIDHFNSLSSLWWDPSKIKVLRALNEIRVPFIKDGLRDVGAIKDEHSNMTQPLRGLKILDVGCGGGLLSEALARLGCSVTGVDAAEEVIKVAKHHASLDSTLSKLSYEYSTMEDYAVGHAETYDVVIASEVIEHVENKEIFLEACVKCLKPGGTIFITTINKTNTAWFVFIVLGEYIMGTIARGTHEWEKFISPDDMEAMLKDCNCRAVSPARGMSYSFFSGKWYFARNDYAAYGLQAIKN